MVVAAVVVLGNEGTGGRGTDGNWDREAMLRRVGSSGIGAADIHGKLHVQREGGGKRDSPVAS